MTDDDLAKVTRRLAAVLFVLAMVSPQPVRGDAVVGTGTPDSCTEAALDSALAAGGNVTFSCGTSPVTIMVTSLKTMAAQISIDGGNLITISGGGTTGVFVVNAGVTLTLANLVIANGHAHANGGAVANGGTLTVNNCTFANNVANYSGGAIINSAGSTLTVTDSIFTGSNVAIENDGGTLTVTDSTFASNSDNAIENDSGTLTVTNSTFSGNNGHLGGAIDNYIGTATVTDSTFSGNNTSNSGIGGAIYNGEMLTVTNSTFANNGATYAGAIENDGGTLTVNNSTFSGNRSGFYGGAILNDGGRFTVSNSTFANNRATFGGAIGNGSLIMVTVTNCTFAGNSASYDGAIINYGGALTLTNTIVANNPGVNCAGAISDGGHNLQFGDNSCGGSIPVIDPKLDPAGLANNGGSTQTIALLAGSPAINAGDETVCAGSVVNSLDQRGFIRPGIGSDNCSIGAFEYNSLPPSCAADCNHDGLITVDEVVLLVNLDLGTGPVPACLPPNDFVGVDQILAAVNALLNGCPVVTTPVATATPLSPTPTP